jgi:enoyl-[acyl-carrier-protein] reductase (NADH)
MNELRGQWERVDIFVSNVSVALVVNQLKDYSLKALSKTIEYSAWPMVAYTSRIHETFGRYPRYVVAMSSTGPDSYSKGYDFMAGSKAVMEAICRYMSYRLYDEDIRINVVRSRRRILHRCNRGIQLRRCAVQRPFGRHAGPGNHGRPRYIVFRQPYAPL